MAAAVSNISIDDIRILKPAELQASVEDKTGASLLLVSVDELSGAM